MGFRGLKFATYQSITARRFRRRTSRSFMAERKKPCPVSACNATCHVWFRVNYPQHIHNGPLDTYRDNLVLCSKSFTGRPYRPRLQIGALAMTTSRFAPPLDYLQAASRSSLQSFELAHLNHASNLRNEIAALIDQWITETSEAMLARWMLDHHKSLQPPSHTPSELVQTVAGPVATLFPEIPSPISEFSPAPPRFAPPRPQLKDSLTRKSQKQRNPAFS
jgi:hypothetical protein